MTILERIVDATREDVERRRRERVPLAALEARLRPTRPEPRPFAEALDPPRASR